MSDLRLAAPTTPQAEEPSAVRRAWIAPVALLVVATGLGIGADLVGATASAVIHGIAGLATVAALIYGVRHNRAFPRTAWSLITVGIGVWVAGDAIWDTLLIAQVDAESGWFNIPNILYLSMYPALLAAIASLVLARGQAGNLDKIIDCGILSFAVVLVFRMFIVGADFTGNTLQDLYSAAYPFGDALLLGSVAWLVFRPGKRPASAWLLSAGIALTFGADLAWDLAIRFNTSAWDFVISPLYPVAYALIAAAALHPSVARLADRTQEGSRHVRPLRLAFLSASLALVLIVALRGNHHDVIMQFCLIGLVAGLAIRFATLVRDTERAYREADTSERRFRILATASPVGIYEATADLEIVFANEESELIVGKSVVGMDARRMIAEMVDPRDQALIYTAVDELGVGNRAKAQFRIHDVDGNEHWVAWYGVPAREGPGPFLGAFVSTMDITALKDAEAMLALQASHDPLTGLPNRRLFLDRLSTALTRLGRQPGTISVLFLDLDRFKQVNDQLGHDAGDELLKVVTSRILNTVRTTDTVARFGGDEFVVLLEQVDDRAYAGMVADKIITAISAPIELAAGRGEVSASVGVAISTNQHDDPDALVRDADTAMYQAKRLGHAQFRFFDNAAVYDDPRLPRPAEPAGIAVPGS
jgi:diguanylate cyclase (GGDEF)-like protein/PAS domain S-box-containing protein